MKVERKSPLAQLNLMNEDRPKQGQNRQGENKNSSKDEDSQFKDVFEKAKKNLTL